MKEIILGLIQGLTEFLPVSSSGHLTVFSKFLEVDQNLAYFAMLHLATFFAVFIYLFKDIVKILKGIFTLDKNYLSLALKIIISTIPAVIAGFLLNDFFEQVFSSVKYVGIFLAVTGLLMLFSDRLNKNRKDIFTLSYTEALFIGLIQAVAILPGISRSGSTLFAALLFGMKKEDAVKYSFLMSLPVTFGAGILEMQKGVFNSWHYIGMAAAFLSGLFGLYLLRKTVINGKTKYFAFYCFAISAVTLIFL